MSTIRDQLDLPNKIETTQGTYVLRDFSEIISEKVTPDQVYIALLKKMFKNAIRIYQDMKFMDLNLGNEYDLILKKKSKLSSNQRKWLMFTFQFYYVTEESEINAIISDKNILEKEKEKK